MELNIIQIFSLLNSFICLLLATFLLTNRSKNYLSNLLLAFFLIVIAIDSDSIFLGRYIYPNYPALGVFLSNLVFLKMPFLFLYFLSVTYSDFKLSWKYLLHAIPWILVTIIFIPNFYAVDHQSQLAFIQSFSLSEWQPEVRYSYILLHVQIISYIIASFYIIGRYRRLLLENYSNASLFNYNFLFLFLSILSIKSIVSSIKDLYMFIGSEDLYFYSLMVTSVLALIYIIWLVMKAMKHPELFRGIDSKLQLVSNMVKKDAELEKPDDLANMNKEVNEKVKRLNSFMAENEPYLDPSLSIYDLAKQTNMPTKELSLLINHDLNQHFFDFVNGFRIRKAMEMLKDPKKKDYTVLEILYDVGFNSKSSFNTAFKKYTQLTPTQYRKKYLKPAA